MLSLNSVRKSYDTKPLLEEVSFSLGEGERMGIVGLNGSGKTTLLRIVAGVEPPDGGAVNVASGWHLAYLPQNPVFDESQTVLDAVFDQTSDRARLLHDYEEAIHRLEAQGDDPGSKSGAGQELLRRVAELSHQLDVTGGWDIEANATAVLGRLGITDTDAVVGTLSGGQRKRVALARALVLRPDLLILDEPTNHLDADTIEWLEGYLATYTGALLIVTHDRYFLDRATNVMLEIERGRVQRFEGNYTRYLEKKEEQSARREAESQKRDSLIRRELAWLRRGAKARTTKQKARVDRAHALMNEETVGPERKIELSAASTRLGNRVVELDHVTKSFDGETFVDDFSYEFAKGDRVGIIGPNGTGKTTLLEMIAGRLKPDAGRVEIGQTAVTGYYDQESRALKDELRLIDYIKEVAETVRTADGSIITASQMLDRFLFPPAVQYTPVGLLSGGERRRLYLLRVLMGAPNVLLLDEPTNDLDISTLIALEDYLDSFAGTVIVVSHDRYFLDRTIERLLYFEGDGRIREIPGNYSAFVEIREREEAEATARATLKSGSRATSFEPSPQPVPTADRKLSFKERRELEELEARIAEAEERQAEIEARLAANNSDYEAIAAGTAELEELVEQLDRDVERWAELAERA